MLLREVCGDHLIPADDPESDQQASTGWPPEENSYQNDSKKSPAKLSLSGRPTQLLTRHIFHTDGGFSSYIVFHSVCHKHHDAKNGTSLSYVV